MKTLRKPAVFLAVMQGFHIPWSVGLPIIQPAVGSGPHSPPSLGPRIGGCKEIDSLSNFIQQACMNGERHLSSNVVCRDRCGFRLLAASVREQRIAPGEHFEGIDLAIDQVRTSHWPFLILAQYGQMPRS
jgi:hypothetical protein